MLLLLLQLILLEVLIITLLTNHLQNLPECRCSLCKFNPLSPNIPIQTLQTDSHTFPLRISWETLINDLGIFSLVIISLILITLFLDNVWILLGENWCWSLLGLKGLKVLVISFTLTVILFPLRPVSLVHKNP